MLRTIEKLLNRFRKSVFARPARPVKRARRAKLEVEGLEQRLLLTVAGFPAPQTGLLGPDQVKQLYGLNNIRFTSLGGAVVNGDGAGQTIAILAASSDSTLSADALLSNNLVNDLALFNTTFKLRQMDGQNGDPTLARWAQDLTGFHPVSANTTAYNSNTDPNNTPALEVDADVQLIHAFAPRANIVIVAALHFGQADIAAAAKFAASLPGVSVVNMSLSSGVENNAKYPINHTLDSNFSHAGVTFIASSGDAATLSGSSIARVEYPAELPTVLSVGGTKLTSSMSEAVWNDSAGESAGGASSLPLPSYQQGFVPAGTTNRTVPDVAALTAPFEVVDSYDCVGPWSGFYGTSASAPQWSALIAIANQGRAIAGMASLNTVDPALPMIYSLPAADFNDITQGGNGLYNAGPGYDLVTGRGSPHADLVVRDLVNRFNGYSSTVVGGQLVITGNQYSSLDTITLSRQGSNLVVTDNQKTDSFLLGSFKSIVITTRAFSNVVNVQTTGLAALTVYSGPGSVVLGASGSLAQITNPVTVTATTASTVSLIVDDSADSSGATATITLGALTDSLTGLSGGSITFSSTNVAPTVKIGKGALTLDDSASTAARSINVTSSAVSFGNTNGGGSSLTVNYSGNLTGLKVGGGNYNETVQVDSTVAGPYTTIATGTGTNSVFIGAVGISSRAYQDITSNWTALQREYNIIIRHTLANIAGPINVQANPWGKTTLTVDDSGEAGRSMTVMNGIIQITGLPIILNSGVSALNLVAGTGNPFVFAFGPFGCPVSVYNIAAWQVYVPWPAPVQTFAGLPSWDANYMLPYYAYLPPLFVISLPTPDPAPYQIYEVSVQQISVQPGIVTRTWLT